MSFLDALTGGAYATANKRNQQTIATGMAQGSGALQTTAQNALGYLLGTPSSMGALQVQDRGFDQATSALGSQYGATQGYLGQLGDLYAPMASAGKGSFDLFNDATGANGAAGQDRARAAFQTDPGYQFSMNQALGAVQRSAASRGGLAGGNTTQGILTAATGLADQAYNQFVNRLAQGSQAYGQGIAGQAGAIQGQASASQNYGNGLNALATGRSAALAGTLGQAAGVQSNLGVNTANLVNGATNSLVASNNAQAQGQTQASQNALGALFGGLNLAAGGVGGAGGLSGLGNVFMGSANPNSLIGRAGSGLASLAGYNPFPSSYGG